MLHVIHSVNYQTWLSTHRYSDFHAPRTTYTCFFNCIIEPRFNVFIFIKVWSSTLSFACTRKRRDNSLSCITGELPSYQVDLKPYLSSHQQIGFGNLLIKVLQCIFMQNLYLPYGVPDQFHQAAQCICLILDFFFFLRFFKYCFGIVHRLIRTCCWSYWRIITYKLRV